MRRAIVTGAATAAGIVLLLSLKPHGAASAQGPVISSDTGAAAPAGGAASGSPSGATSGGTSGGSPSTAPSAAPSSGGSRGGGTAATRTITGSVIDTRYGPVQVRITLTGGKLTKVDVLQYPTDSGRDEEINSYALPQLNHEAIAAGSAQIDSISGATYTSEGYQRSLQSALDQAGHA